MKNNMRYSAHFPRISFSVEMTADSADDTSHGGFVSPPLLYQAATAVQPLITGQPATMLHPIVQAHRHYLQQQTQMYQWMINHITHLQSQIFAAVPNIDIAAIVPSPTLASSKKTNDIHVELSQTQQQFNAQLEAQTQTQLRSSSQVHAQSQESELPGPKFSREDLKVLAFGDISTLFGEWFQPLDQYRRLIRMPEPPLLLADRVTGIDAEPNSKLKGTIYTETDVTKDAWYLHRGCMPAGVMIEAGQADLLLISWLGFDEYNKGDRVYRLLGCELTYSGGLPQVGDTLRYEISVDGHAKQGEVRLFFFRYNCYVNERLVMSVRRGQAGFFTDAELAESGGVLWTADDNEYDQSAPMAEPRINCQHKVFSKAQVLAFAKGDVVTCFGPEYYYAQPHTRTPGIASDKMLFINEITQFDPKGGPWKRGYMAAVQWVDANDWYFKGHFKNDPCMPGTLMLEAGLQVMAFYMTALGYTVNKDGWRFEPVPDETYKLRCRGQVRPSATKVVYEIFIYSCSDGDIPTLYADLLGTVDGLKAFHTKIGVQLVPDWPFKAKDFIEAKSFEDKPAPQVDGFSYDHASLIACALGQPSTGIGPRCKPYDGALRVARLPGPPYHFISRMLEVESSNKLGHVDSLVHVEYDVDPQAWYYTMNAMPVMPYAVLLEAALQPCGWLSSFLCIGDGLNEELLFRNLDGTATLTRDIVPSAEILRNHITCTRISKLGNTILTGFTVKSYLDDELIYEMDTLFGFFPPKAFLDQPGLAIPDYEQGMLEKASDVMIDLTVKPFRYCCDELRLPEPMLLMLDRVSGFWPDQGSKGLGMMRADKDVNPEEWFFKAHFFQDPVQPGSLGIEAMIQLLQFYMIHTDMHQGIAHPRFEALALDQALTWKYRGQVVPKNKIIQTMIDITEKGKDERGVYAIANASLWVDGKRIYEAEHMGVRIVSESQALPKLFHEEIIFDPTRHAWVNDHCPTFAKPTMPMTFSVNLMAQAAQAYFPKQQFIAANTIVVKHWLMLDKLKTLMIDVGVDDEHTATVKLYQKENGNQRKLIIEGVLQFGADYLKSPELPQLDKKAELMEDPYLHSFNDGSFKVIKEYRKTKDNGFISKIDFKDSAMPAEHMLGLALDSLVQTVPHNQLGEFFEGIEKHKAAYPLKLQSLQIHGPTPVKQDMIARTEFIGLHQETQLPTFRITAIANDAVWAILEFSDVLVSKGRLAQVPMMTIKQYAQHNDYNQDLLLSTYEANKTRLSIKAIAEIDWLPGTLACYYEVSGDLLQQAKKIAIKEHFARQFKCHPREVIYFDEGSASLRRDPNQFYFCTLTQERGDIIIELDGA